MLKKTLFILIFFLFANCKQNIKETFSVDVSENKIKTDYATGFDIDIENEYTIISLKTPWKNATKKFKYLLLNREDKVPNDIVYDELIRVPVNKIVVTSTTHIPALEALGELDKLLGFPNTDYISSIKARSLITNGNITELGKNESLNLEKLILLSPEVVVGFGVDGSNKALNNVKKFGIPVLYNSEWLEQHALGRAEWIKFFGYLFKKETLANNIFNKIKDDYNNAKKLAKSSNIKPSVLSGMPFKDTWYLPYGNSWAVQFLNDANASYLWSNVYGKGSLSLNFEAVLEKAKTADYWVAIGDFQTKKQLLDSNLHYNQFNMVKDNNVYISNKKGATGGLLFYELAPSRPDLILKDLIKIFHPELLPNYQLNFYTQLN
jgi:iron complex transport system substrate-binding protein